MTEATEKIARLLSAITEHDIKIECDFTQTSENCYTSNNLVNQTGAVGKQMYRSIVLKYVTQQFGKYIALTPEFEYDLLNGGFYGYYDIPRDYIFDTEKDTFIFGEDKKQAENEIVYIW